MTCPGSYAYADEIIQGETHCPVCPHRGPAEAHDCFGLGLVVPAHDDPRVCPGSREIPHAVGGGHAQCGTCSAWVAGAPTLADHAPLLTERDGGWPGVHAPDCGEGEPIDEVTGERAHSCGGVPVPEGVAA